MVQPSSASLQSPHSQDDTHSIFKKWLKFIKVVINCIHSENILILGQGCNVSSKFAIIIKDVVLSDDDVFISVDVKVSSWPKVSWVIPIDIWLAWATVIAVCELTTVIWGLAGMGCCSERPSIRLHDIPLWTNCIQELSSTEAKVILRWVDRAISIHGW